ncbi:MAG: hypothetical protein ACYTF0_07055, partial [Planctomycetota bacterium]
MMPRFLFLVLFLTLSACAADSSTMDVAQTPPADSAPGDLVAMIVAEVSASEADQPWHLVVSQDGQIRRPDTEGVITLTRAPFALHVVMRDAGLRVGLGALDRELRDFRRMCEAATVPAKIVGPASGLAEGRADPGVPLPVSDSGHLAWGGDDGLGDRYHQRTSHAGWHIGTREVTSLGLPKEAGGSRTVALERWAGAGLALIPMVSCAHGGHHLDPLYGNFRYLAFEDAPPVPGQVPWHFDRMPYVHPFVIEELTTWLSDGGDQALELNLNACQDSNRYAGAINAVEVDDGAPWVVCARGRGGSGDYTY